MPITTTSTPHGNGPNDARRRELITEACDLLGATDAARRAEVESRLVSIAADFRSGTEAAEATPGMSESREAVKAVARAGKAFSEALAGIGRYLTLGAATFTFRDNAALRAAAETERDKLTADASAFGPQIDDLQTRLELRAHRWPDNLGPTTPHTMTKGPPKLILAEQCKNLFLSFRPDDKPTQSDTGDFAELVKRAYELATGKGGDELGVGLKRYIEMVCRERGA